MLALAGAIVIALANSPAGGAIIVRDICTVLAPDGTSLFCQPCGPGGCPDGGGPVLVCCDPLSSPPVCVVVPALDHCGAGNVTGACNYGISYPDGSVECFEE
jgi:hypothetical protein